MGYGGDVSGFATLKVTVEVAQLVKWVEDKIDRTSKRIEERVVEFDKLANDKELVKALIENLATGRHLSTSNAPGAMARGSHEQARIAMLSRRIGELRQTKSGLINTLVGLKAHQGLKTMEIQLQLVQSLAPKDTFGEDADDE